jgi:hypothetical protein
VQRFIAVRHCTAKISLPCGARGTHGKEIKHGKVLWWRTAKYRRTAKLEVSHGNALAHGKALQKRTAKKPGRQRSFAVRCILCRALHSLPWCSLCRAARNSARQSLLCRALHSLPCANNHLICFSNYFISSNTYIYFVN